jgi:hypothetical protein
MQDKCKSQKSKLKFKIQRKSEEIYYLEKRSSDERAGLAPKAPERGACTSPKFSLGILDVFER